MHAHDTHQYTAHRSTTQKLTCKTRASSGKPVRHYVHYCTFGSCTLPPKCIGSGHDPYPLLRAWTTNVPLNLDSALLGSAIERHPLQDDFARTTSISQDFTRVTSAEDRMFARLLSVERQGQPPNVSWAVCHIHIYVYVYTHTYSMF